MSLRISYIGLLICIGLNENGLAQFNFNVKRSFGETNHQIIYASFNSAGNYIVTAGSDSSIIIWNADRGIIYRTLTGLKARPNAAQFSTDDEFLFSGGKDNKVSMWDLGSMPLRIIKTFEGHTGAIKSLDISPDGKYLATGSEDRSVKIWDINSNNLVFDLKAHKDDVNAVKFSPDGKILASGGADKNLFLWNVATGSIIRSRAVHNGWIRDVAFSPDGSLIASCGDDKLIQVCKLPDLSMVKSLKGHKDWVQTIDISPDGKYLLSGGHDQLIILWDIAAGTILSQSVKQGQVILSVDFSPIKSDFITAGLLSEQLETWAISGDIFAGPDNSTIINAERISDASGVKQITSKKVSAFDFEESVAEGKLEKPPLVTDILAEDSMIELFSPVTISGKAIDDKSSTYVIGRASDPAGINVLLVNKNPVKLSEAGVFEFKINLSKGNNLVSIIAINNKGKLNERTLVIESVAENIPLPEQGIQSAPTGKYYALLIGINDYQSSEITDLDNPVRDAQSLYDVLSENYSFDKENIIFLKNPTQEDIITTLDGLAGKLTSHDNLLIFYAGHGYWDEKGKVGYWFPSDANRNSTVNWFRNSTLRDFIGSIETKHTLLIADACFSGAIFKTRAAFTDAPQGIKTLDELPSRKAMTSGILQEVPDESVFIRYLVNRLAENKEKFLTSELLFSSFKTAVMNNSSNVPQYGVIQNVGDEGGDFIFVRR